MSKFKKIAFPHGGFVPAEQAKGGKAQQKAPHDPVEVAEAYAEQLIADRFAYEWNKDTARPVPPSAGDVVAAAEAKAAELVKTAETKAADIVATAEAKAKDIIADAQTKVAELLKSSGGTDDGKSGGGGEKS